MGSCCPILCSNITIFPATVWFHSAFFGNAFPSCLCICSSYIFLSLTNLFKKVFPYSNFTKTFAFHTMFWLICISEQICRVLETIKLPALKLEKEISLSATRVITNTNMLMVLHFVTCNYRRCSNLSVHSCNTSWASMVFFFRIANEKLG